MSLKKVEQVKKSKWFRPWDLLVYGLLAAAIVALILAFVLPAKSGGLDGVVITYRGDKVFECDFSAGGYKIYSEKNIEVKKESGERLLLTFHTDGDGGFNDIEIDIRNKSAKVTAADCSLHKDCVYTSALTSSRSAPIICTPHALAVLPLNFDDGVIKT